MKIGIDARSILKRSKRTGIGYYTMNLISALASVDPDNRYYLYSFIKFFDLKRRLPALPGKNFNHRLDRFKFRPDVKMADMDVVHSSSYDFPKPGCSRMVSTVHDIIPLVHPENHTEGNLVKLESKIKKVLDKSNIIVADSQSTKNDIQKVFSPAGKDIRVIYPGRDETLFPIEDKKELQDHLKKSYGIDGKFILYVGTVEKRKNVSNLVRAYFDIKKEKNLPHALVIAGMKGWGGEETYELAENSGLKDNVFFTGYVPREDMARLYNGAELFVYPSSYEGFGFPILEAFSCGTPVITSSGTSCGEVAGEAAVTIDPNDINALKQAMFNVLSDPDLGKELGEKGLERARLFTWQQAARQFKEIFHSLGDVSPS